MISFVADGINYATVVIDGKVEAATGNEKYVVFITEDKECHVLTLMGNYVINNLFVGDNVFVKVSGYFLFLTHDMDGNKLIDLRKKRLVLHKKDFLDKVEKFS